MKRITLSFVGAAVLAIAAVAPAAAQDGLTVDLREVDGSGQSGSIDVTTVEGEDQVTVEITLEGGEEDAAQPANLHEGSCEDLGDAAFPLNDVEDGASETTVDVTMSELLAGEYAISVQQSEDAADVTVACGDLPLIGGPADDEEEGEADEEGDDESAEAEDEEAAEDDEGDDSEESGDDNADGAEDSADNGEGSDAEDEGTASSEDDDTEGELAPETGDSGMVDAQSSVLFMTVVAGGALGAGLLVRRLSHQA